MRLALAFLLASSALAYEWPVGGSDTSLGGPATNSGSQAAGTTTSVTIWPQAEATIFVLVALKSTVGAAPSITTPTGFGLTWRRITSVVWQNPRKTAEAWEAYSPTSLAPGSVTFGLVGSGGISFAYQVDQWLGVAPMVSSTADNVVQSVVGHAAGLGTATTASLTLAAYEGPDDRALLFVLTDNGGAYAPGVGFSPVFQDSNGLLPTFTEWQDGTPTVLDATWADSVAYGAIAFELRAGPTLPSIRDANDFPTRLDAPPFVLPAEAAQ